MVENRLGAGGAVGMGAAARAPADGHTVLIAGFTMASMTALRTKLPFEPLRELAGITRLGTQPFVLSVHPSLPVKSIAELVALARTRPSQLVYAVNGYGSAQHLQALKLLGPTPHHRMSFAPLSRLL